MRSEYVWKVVLELQGADTQVVVIACVAELRHANLVVSTWRSLCDELNGCSYRLQQLQWTGGLSMLPCQFRPVSDTEKVTVQGLFSCNYRCQSGCHKNFREMSLLLILCSVCCSRCEVWGASLLCCQSGREKIHEKERKLKQEASIKTTTGGGLFF